MSILPVLLYRQKPKTTRQCYIGLTLRFDETTMVASLFRISRTTAPRTASMSSSLQTENAFKEQASLLRYIPAVTSHISCRSSDFEMSDL